ncbi:hypothetical protein [Treponema sp.]|uniref:hypothetical protein n=1 Tax=Treponema sp. TaxID=166 RepID=UPI0025F623C5|nr:hypothetical protein [Treponema sp.]MCR5218611.1 hypothetical protein [Treponema sp.]
MTRKSYEEEEFIDDIGIHPNLVKYLDLFTRVSEIRIDYLNYYTVLTVRLDNGVWSFFVFYDRIDNPNKQKNHENLIKSVLYYLGEMK